MTKMKLADITNFAHASPQTNPVVTPKQKLCRAKTGQVTVAQSRCVKNVQRLVKTCKDAVAKTSEDCPAGVQASSHVSVAVVAPGGGTGANAAVYSALAQSPDFSVHILGKSRAPYDRYPSAWADGSAEHNLESFASQLLLQGCLAETGCLVVGSRGGQVVLPTLWRECSEEVPPAVVMNGGCAMDLPIPVHWPESAVTFLLLGGNDYFRGCMGMEEYLTDVQRRVPQGNTTTAILFILEMLHMPQASLLMAIMEHMIRAVTSWKSTGLIPADDFGTILDNLRSGGWNGCLIYKTGKGDSWKPEAFSRE